MKARGFGSGPSPVFRRRSSVERSAQPGLQLLSGEAQCGTYGEQRGGHERLRPAHGTDPACRSHEPFPLRRQESGVEPSEQRLVLEGVELRKPGADAGECGVDGCGAAAGWSGTRSRSQRGERPHQAEFGELGPFGVTDRAASLSWVAVLAPIAYER